MSKHALYLAAADGKLELITVGEFHEIIDVVQAWNEQGYSFDSDIVGVPHFTDPKNTAFPILESLEQRQAKLRELIRHHVGGWPSTANMEALADALITAGW